MSIPNRKFSTTADTLKKIDEILLPDMRFQSFGWKGPEQFHKELTQYQLNASVPRQIQSQFDNARNLLLYSWYVYGFSAASDLIAYSALEMAIRLKIAQTDAAKAEKTLGLKVLIRHALKAGWWRDEKVRHYLKIKEIYNSGSYLHNDIIPDDPDSCKWLLRIEDSFPNLRNGLAHGGHFIHPPDFSTISLCCDLINQLYPEPCNYVST